MSTQQTTNRPSHIVWQVIDNDREDGKGFFRRIGAAWPNKRGTGLNVVLDAIPLTGRIALLAPQEEDSERELATAE
jgi:hypothetical protein